jgi:hypothetical protein
MSHTATGEWQSFELRMRRRRAERLALRAEAAASAGFEDDARACLAEARTLAPDLPEVAAAEAALHRQPEPLLPAAPPAARSRSLFVSAAACILLAAFVGGWMAYRDVPEVAEAVPAHVELAADPAPVDAVPLESAPAAPVPVRAISETATIPSGSPPVRAEVPAARETRAPERVVRDTPAVGAKEGLPAIPTTEVAAPPVPPPAPARVEPPPAVTAEAPSAGLAGTSLPPPSVDVKAPAVEMSQEPVVQGVLNRFASAYSALDAAAAERVWPTVNRGALARAFDGLATQRVSLGDCRIDVTGSKARARCAGSATWSPKVGSGTHTESRVWTFDLVRVGAGWQILNARAQNK